MFFLNSKATVASIPRFVFSTRLACGFRDDSVNTTIKPVVVFTCQVGLTGSSLILRLIVNKFLISPAVFSAAAGLETRTPRVSRKRDVPQQGLRQGHHV